MWETTTLYIELLIIGFEASLWLLLLAFSIPGADKLSGSLKDLPLGSGLLVVGFALASAYLLGIVFDKVAHRLLGANRELLRRRLDDITEERDDADSRWIYARFMVHEKRAVPDILYARSKVRILRASVLNVPLIAIAGALFLGRQRIQLWWLVLVVGMGLWILVCFAYVYTQGLYRRRLLRFNAYLADEPGDAPL
jgi:hypothetical protein